MLGLPTCRAAGLPLSICCKNLYHILPGHVPCLRHGTDTDTKTSEIRPCRNVEVLDILSLGSGSESPRLRGHYPVGEFIDVAYLDIVFRCNFASPACIAHINTCRFNILSPCPV